MVSRTFFAYSFLVLPVLCTCVSLSGCGGEQSVPADQQAAHEEIKRLGGVPTIDPVKGIVAVSLNNSAADNATIEKLAACKDLAFLDIGNTQVTDAAVDTLLKMTNLRTLNVGPRAKQVPMVDADGQVVRDDQGQVVMENEPILSKAAVARFKNELQTQERWEGFVLNPDITEITEQNREFGAER